MKQIRKHLYTFCLSVLSPLLSFTSTASGIGSYPKHSIHAPPIQAIQIHTPPIPPKPDPPVPPPTPVAAPQSAPIPQPVKPTPPPVRTVPVASPSVYEGTGDASLDWIFDHESGSNPYARNASGACGLGQALPCSKLLLVCGSLSNIPCQITFFKHYCISRYGSTYDAMLFWKAHAWY